MAMGLLESGPKFDWTRDNKIFDRFQIWKEKVEMIFSSALLENTPEQKVAYLRYWMGDQGIPLVKKWTALGKLDFTNPTDGGRDRPISSGFILQNYWKLLEAEFKPKGNKLLSVIELWTRSRQGSKTLNEWLTYVYNLVESCDYGDSNDRIIRDVLIIGCNSDKAKDKIVRQGEKIKLQEVIEILQLEDSTRQTLTEMNSTVQKVRNPRVTRTSRNSKIILMVLILLLAGRNRLLQVLASSATDARNPSPKDMKKSARQSMPSVMHVVLLAIIKLLVENLVTFHRKLILLLILQEE